MITEQDIMENILQPELESAIWALIQKSGPEPIRYNNDGLTRIMKACDSHLASYPDITLDEMQRRADEFIMEIFGR